MCGVCAFLFHRERGKKICREKDLEQNETTQREREREREGKEREGDGEGAAVVDPEEGVEVFFFVSKKKTQKNRSPSGGRQESSRENELSSLFSLSLSLLSLQQDISSS